MQPPKNPDIETETTAAAPSRKLSTPPDFSVAVKPIGEFAGRADWPHCAIGVHVSINGVEGVVVEVINQSIKLVSADRTIQRFNSGRLKTLFGTQDRSASGNGRP